MTDLVNHNLSQLATKDGNIFIKYSRRVVFLSKGFVLVHYSNSIVFHALV
jgi:hypothetical protein